MRRREAIALVLVAMAAGFAAGRLSLPQLATAAGGEAGGGGAERTMVGFQLVPASGPRQRDLLIRGWDTGDIDYIDVSRQGRDEDPVRYLWTDSHWRFVSQYPPER